MGFLFRPVHGLITNNTARLMFEVSRSDSYIFTYNEIGSPDKITTEYYVKAGKPCVLQLENLLADTEYNYSLFDIQTNEIINGSFKTLNINFCMITPSSEIHEENGSEELQYSNITISSDSPFSLSLNSLSLPPLSLEPNKTTNQEINTPNQQQEKTINLYINYDTDLKQANKDYGKMKVEDTDHVKNLVRNIYRKNWNSLNTNSNVMIANYVENPKNSIYNECVREVYDEYQRGLRINNHTTIKDYFLIQYGNVGYIFIDELNQEQLDFIRNNIPRCKVLQWVIISPYSIFTKPNKEIVLTLLSLFPQKCPLFIFNHNSATEVLFIKRNNKTIGYQIALKSLQLQNNKKKKTMKSCNKYKFKTDWKTHAFSHISITSHLETSIIKIHYTTEQKKEIFQLTI